MIFNNHFALAGRHAVLSASKYHWLRYSDEKFDEVYKTQLAARAGTQMHDLAANLIKLKVKLPRVDKTLNLYVNDAIGFRMEPEQMVVYSANAFGTADALSFRKGVLRVHDLKTGTTKASFDQLIIYVAFFCLEYDVRPGEIQIELRIYQNDEVQIYEPEVEEVIAAMSTIIRFDRRIQALEEQFAE
jgi:hypothetical protein